MASATSRIGERGTVVLPEDLRRRFGLDDGTLVTAEASDGGILIRPVVPDPDEAIEIYTPERIAEFILSNAVDADDYANAVEEVRAMGLDPDAIEHYRPAR